MMPKRTEGAICLDGLGNLVYQIGTIAYTIFEDETFRYEFVPNWAVIDLLGPPDFQGVPGFDLAERKDVYVRENMTPTFIAERAPAENREGLWQMLADAGMDYLDKVEWLVRTDTRYIGDGLYVRTVNQDKAGRAFNQDETHGTAEIAETVAAAQNSTCAALAILQRLCTGDSITLDGNEIGSDERKVLHTTLRALVQKTYDYREKRQKKGVNQAAKRGVYAGRKRKAIDKFVLEETLYMYEEGMLNAHEAARRLDVSQATFFRRLNEHRSQTGVSNLP